jgi:spermidine synthase
VAVLWRGTMGGRRIEVRGAGATRRLLVDGVLHTAWNPRLGVTGAVWDPLAFAAWLRVAADVRSALVLGVGGGAAVQLLRRHMRPGRILGVDREAALLDVARRWFDLAGPDVELVADDAVAWVRSAREGGRRAVRFDLVVDDLFHEACGEPVRSASGTHWWRAVASLVAPGGVLVVNFSERRILRASALAADPWFRTRFPRAVRFACPGYTNAIVALGDADLDPRALRRRIRTARALTPAARRALRFRTAWEWRER